MRKSNLVVHTEDPTNPCSPSRLPITSVCCHHVSDPVNIERDGGPAGLGKGRMPIYVAILGKDPRSVSNCLVTEFCQAVGVYRYVNLSYP